MSRAIIILLLFLLLFFACGLLEPSEEDESWSYKTIYEIWILNSDGSTETYLTNGIYPAFTSDGLQIIFMRDDRFMKINIDGSEEKPITGQIPGVNGFNMHHPSRLIIFDAVEYFSFNYDLFIMNDDGAELTNLTNTTFEYEWAPKLSADGSRILFVQPDGIYTMDLKGVKTQLVSLNSGTISQVQFSASGKKVICLRHPSIHVQIIDTQTGLVDTTIVPSNESFAVCPTRDEIALNSQELCLLDLYTYQKTRLAGYNQAPVYSPDGNKIIYIDLYRNLVIIDLLSGESRLVAASLPLERSYRYLTYSIAPDNSKIVAAIAYEIEN
jgi:Tol biopolymer transport system component